MLKIFWARFRSAMHSNYMCIKNKTMLALVDHRMREAYLIGCYTKKTTKIFCSCGKVFWEENNGMV